MLFLTAADTKFYFFLPYMTAQIERHFPKARLIVYDLGLEEQERLQLNEWDVETRKWHIGPGNPITGPNKYPRALHKASVVLDALQRDTNEYIMYLDADAIPSRSFKMPPDFDVAVTLVNQYDLSIIETKPDIEYNGIFNTGVMLFGRSKRRIAFAEEWAERLSNAGRWESDQRIAWLLLEEMEGFSRQEYNVTRILKVRGEDVRIRILEAEVWNMFALRSSFLMGKKRVHPDDVNVLHFKGSLHNTFDFRNCMKMGQIPLETKGVPLC